MIPVEPFRLEMLTPIPGMIGVNEDGQKFKVKISSRRLITLEPYEGKKPATFFIYMGPLPDPDK